MFIQLIVHINFKINSIIFTTFTIIKYVIIITTIVITIITPKMYCYYIKFYSDIGYSFKTF